MLLKQEMRKGVKKRISEHPSYTSTATERYRANKRKILEMDVHTEGFGAMPVWEKHLSILLWQQAPKVILILFLQKCLVWFGNAKITNTTVLSLWFYIQALTNKVCRQPLFRRQKKKRKDSARRIVNGNVSWIYQEAVVLFDRLRNQPHGLKELSTWGSIYLYADMQGAPKTQL